MDAPTTVTEEAALATWTTLFSQTVHGVQLDQLFGSDLKTIKKWARSRPTEDEKILVTRAAKLISIMHETTEQILEMGLSPAKTPSARHKSVPVHDEALLDADGLGKDSWRYVGRPADCSGSGSRQGCGRTRYGNGGAEGPSTSYACMGGFFRLDGRSGGVLD